MIQLPTYHQEQLSEQVTEAACSKSGFLTELVNQDPELFGRVIDMFSSAKDSAARDTRFVHPALKLNNEITVAVAAIEIFLGANPQIIEYLHAKQNEVNSELNTLLSASGGDQ